MFNTSHLGAFAGNELTTPDSTDYRRFAALGDIITHEMRHLLEREMKRAERAAGRDQEETPAAVTAAASTENSAGPDSEGGESERTPDPDTPPQG